MDSDIKKKIFEEAQALLPEDKRVARNVMCMAMHDDYICSLETGRKGLHVAHSVLGHIVAEW